MQKDRSSRRLMPMLLVTCLFGGPTAVSGAELVLLGRNVEESVESELDVLARDDISSVDSASRVTGWIPARNLERREGVVWGRLKIDAVSAARELWLLEADAAWDLVELFVRKPGGWSVERTGRSVAVRDLPVDHPGCFLPLHVDDILSPGSEVVYFRFVRARGGYGPPAGFLTRAGPATEILAAERRSAMFDGAFTGVAFAMAFYNLFLYFVLRDRARLWYTLYVVAFGLFWVSGKGLLAESLWPGFPGRGSALEFVLICASVIFGTMFARDFLQLSEHAPRMKNLLDVVIAIPVAALTLGAAGVWGVAENMAAIGALAGFAAYIAAGFAVLRADFTPARYFLLAWGVLACGGVPFIFAYFGLLPFGGFVRNAPRVAAAIEMVLLALALGYRIRVLESENREAREEYTTRMESDVRERTSELEAANKDLRALNVRLEELSLKDELTGIANRRLFDASLDEEWRRASRTRAPLSVLLGDIDHFKRYNDWYGHQRGDKCLRRVAEVLAVESRRAGELVARYGGEEFGVILPGVTCEDAVRRAEEMRLRLEREKIAHAASPSTGFVTISFGVACCLPHMDDDSTELLKQADRALYRAKAHGRNRVEVARAAAGR